MTHVATWPALLAARAARVVRRLVGAARRAGVTPVGLDLALAAASLVAMLVERLGATAVTGAKLPLAVSLSVVIAAGLALRRRAPVAGYMAGSLALAAESLLVVPSPISPYPNLIGIYSLGLYAARGRAWWGPPVAIAGVLAYFGPHPSSLGALFSWLVSWALGYSTARRREEQQRSRLLLRAEAVAEERTRIARELHDLVGHTVTLMLVQAGAARRVLDSDPGQSRELLSTMESTGREALGELDRMLGMLRQAEPGDDPGDEPGLASLRGLVERMGRAGIEVTVDSDVAEARLSRSMSVCAYRIIQEALINALKHGHAGAARVTLRQTDTALGLEVSDDGRGVPHGYDPGRGLLGIGERAALFGGTVTHGGGDGGGFRLRAALPLG